MNEAPRAPAYSGLQRALALTIIACLALSAWGIVSTRRQTSGLKRAPAPAPLKPQSRERVNWAAEPEPVCVQASSATPAASNA